MINRLKLEVRKLKDENHELRQKLGSQGGNTLPRLKNRNHDGGKAFPSAKDGRSTVLF